MPNIVELLTQLGAPRKGRQYHAGTWPMRYHLGLMALVVLAFIAADASFKSTRIAAGDPQEYLYLAHTLAHEGVYAYSPEEARPGALAAREPLYPALLASIMRFDPALYAASRDCLKALGAGCEEALPILSKVNVVLLGLAALALSGAVLALGGPPWAAWLAGGYMLLNFQAARDIGWVI